MAIIFWIYEDRELGDSSSLVWSQRNPVEKSRLIKTVKDQVCGMLIDPDTAAATSEYKGRIYHFCAWGCRVAFERDPEMHIGSERGEAAPMTLQPDLVGPPGDESREVRTPSGRTWGKR